MDTHGEEVAPRARTPRARATGAPPLSRLRALLGTNSMRIQRLLLPAALAASLPLVWAMPVNGGAHAGPSALCRVPSELLDSATGTIHGAVSAHMDLDGRLDVLAHIGDDLIYVSGPDVTGFAQSLGLSGVTAFTTVEVRDTWLENAAFADGESLKIATTKPFAVDEFSVAVSPIGSASWAGARWVQRVDVNADGIADIVGLSASGTQVLQLRGLGGDHWSELAPAPLALPMDGARVVRRGTELVLCGLLRDPAGDTLRFVSMDGLPILDVPMGGHVSDLEPLRNAAGGDDEVAVLMGGSVSVVHASGLVEAAVSLSAWDPTAIDTADLSGDGLDDLLLNSTLSDAGHVLVRAPEGGPSAFGGASCLDFPWDSPEANMGVQASSPVAGDFDGDGDLDLFQFIDDHRCAAMRRSAVFDETPFRSVIENAEWFLSSASSVVHVPIRVQPLEDGQTPDAFEIMLMSQPVGAEAEAPMERVFIVDQPNTTPIGGLASYWVPFDGDLGPHSVLSVRGLSLDAVTNKIDVIGVEGWSGYWRTVDDPTRGTHNGVGEIPVPWDDPNDKWPPPPPKPVDPFAKPQ